MLPPAPTAAPAPRIRPNRRRALLGGAAALALSPLGRAAGPWPSRPITVVVPFAPGGIADLSVRAIATALTAQLGQPLVIDNRPGAGAIIGTQAVVRAEPDGHTLLLLSNANAVSASLFRKLPYDVTRDLAPVSTLGFFDLAVLSASPGPWRSLAQVLGEARAHPARLTLGTITPGSTQHLCSLMLCARAGIEVVSVAYKGTPALLAALRSGEIDLAIEMLGPMLPQIASGAVRALAVTSHERFVDLPDVPTAQESGVEGFDVASWNALAAPAATPPAVVAQLGRACRAALADPGVTRTLRALGVRPRSSTPAELARLLATDTLRWGEAIQSAGIEPQ